MREWCDVGGSGEGGFGAAGTPPCPAVQECWLSEAGGTVYASPRAYAYRYRWSGSALTSVAASPSAPPPALRRDGVRFALPPGWSAHIRTLLSTPIAVLQAGNFRLPTGDDDTGTKAHTRMTARSIFIVMLEAGSGDTGFSYKPHTLPVTISRRDFLPMFEGVPSNYGFARTFFASHGRRFQLWVEFGSKPASVVALREANAALGGLRVSAVR